MADKVFINGRSAIHAGSAGRSMCFPDVNLCPPPPPSGPVPVPLPNVAKAADLQGGASSVLIEGNPMAKKSSFFAKSTGNESAQSTGGGIISHVVQGKAYFVSYSFDVTIEGEEAPRHLDMMTHNHAGPSPPNSAVGTYLGSMDPAAIPPAKAPAPKRKSDGKPQAIEFFFDHEAGVSPAGADSMLLVSDDGKYRSSLALSAAKRKGDLMSLQFEQVLPRKAYSLYWQIADEQMPLFEHVPFESIREHQPGSERPAPSAQSASDSPQSEDGDGGGDRRGPPATSTDQPAEWHERPIWKRR